MNKSDQEYFDERKRILDGLRIPLYPSMSELFKPTIAVKDFCKQHDLPTLAAGAHVNEADRLVGRIEGIKKQDKNIYTFNVWENNSKVLVTATATFYSEPAKFSSLMPYLRENDTVGITCIPARTKTGDFTVIPGNLALFTPCMYPLPKKLEDKSIRFKQRYLDLQVNHSSRTNLITRSRVIRSIRECFDHMDFIEVETPVLNTIVGGASAKPYKIADVVAPGEQHYMRIDPELYLKKLVIGGMDRVYEIGKVFRDVEEDKTHMKEFTLCEAYCSNLNYTDLMELSQELLRQVIRRIMNKTMIFDYQGQSIDFTKDFKKLNLIGTLEEKLGCIFPEDLESESTRLWLDDILKTKGIPCAEPRTTPKLIDRLLHRYIAPECIQPTFVIDYPRIMSPLARCKVENEQLTERFELFIGGMEICDAYSELNEPAVQVERFKDQAVLGDPGYPLDPDYIHALQYGFPPAGGWGLGIDRFVMLLTNTTDIREIVTFTEREHKSTP